MERNFTIKVKVDDTARAGTSVTHHQEGSSLYEINIVPSGDAATLPDTLAHELGHVIGRFFNLKSTQNDPRHIAATQGISGAWNMRARMIGVTPEEGQAMLDNEQEAWDFARKMKPDLDPEGEKVALDSYRANL
jgi:hypothetical protein